MKRLVFVMLFICCTLATYSQVKKVAILETVDKVGSVSYAHKLMLRANLAKAITNTPGYEAYDRTDIDAIMGEQDFQRTGMVSDDQIKRLGEITGADYILVAEAVKVDESNMFITAKILNVETAKTERTDNALMALNAADIQHGCESLANNLLGINIVQVEKDKKKEQLKNDNIVNLNNKETENKLVVNEKKRDKIFDFSCGPLLGIQTNSLVVEEENMGVNEKDNIGWATGITFGGFIRFAIKNMIIQPEVLYDKSVFKLDEFSDISLIRSYLSIPLLLGFQTKGDSFKMRFALGPVYQFLISQNIKVENVSYKSDFKNGMGVAFNIGAEWKRLVLDINYNWILARQKDFDFVYKEKQNVISLTVGIRLF